MQSAASLIVQCAAQDSAGVFHRPIDFAEVPHYLKIITNPLDLSTIAVKLQCGMYAGEHTAADDLMTMLLNCCRFNGGDAYYTPMAEAILESMSDQLLNLRRLPERLNYYCCAVLVEHATEVCDLAQSRWSLEVIRARVFRGELSCPVAVAKLLDLNLVLSGCRLGADSWPLVDSHRASLRTYFSHLAVGLNLHWPELESSWRVEPCAEALSFISIIDELQSIDADGSCSLPDLSRTDFGGPSLLLIRTKLLSNLYGADISGGMTADLDSLVDYSVEIHGPDSKKSCVAANLRRALPRLLKR